jgi:hypothetical protein
MEVAARGTGVEELGEDDLGKEDHGVEDQWRIAIYSCKLTLSRLSS